MSEQRSSKPGWFPASCLAATLVFASACSGGAAPAAPNTAAPPPAVTPPAASSPVPAASAATSPGSLVVPSPSAAASAAPAALPDKPGPLLNVRMAQSIPALSFAPLYIAQALNYFGNQGVQLDLTQLQSGATAQAALIGNSVDMVESTSTDLGAAVGAGVDFIAVQDSANMTNEVCARQDWLTKNGITASSSLQEKVAALKGANIGITSPGSNSDRIIRWLLQKWGNLNPDLDTQIVAVGSVGADSEGLANNRLQAYVSSPPTCELNLGDGSGAVLLKPSDVPEFQNFVLEVLYTTQDYANSHPDALTATATALSMGNNFARQHPQEAIAILQTYFPSVPPQTVATALTDIVFPALPADGKMTSEGWTSTLSVLLESGQITKPLSADEGVLWTNKFIGNASVP